MTPPTVDSSPAYAALALQVTCRAVNRLDPEAARARRLATIDHLRPQIAASKAFIGSDLRLVVLPEYFLTSFPLGESFEEWAAKAALEIDGPDYEKLGALAQGLGVFLAGNAYEVDPNFPGLYFQTSFVIGDSGDVILRYRRLNSMFAPTPHDVWDRYLEIYGLEGVFPVASTPLGRLGAIASEEIVFPEVARCLAMRGAEVFVHSTSEVYGEGDTPKEVAKRARALENMAYVVSANSAGLEDTPIPKASVDGASKVVDYRGLVLARAGTGESMAAHAVLDLEALRRHRRRPGMGNQLARQRFEVYAGSYAGHSHHPPNTLADGEAHRDRLRQVHEETLRRLTDAGVL